jgi:hypothetical protein
LEKINRMSNNEKETVNILIKYLQKGSLVKNKSKKTVKKELSDLEKIYKNFRIEPIVGYSF